MWIIMELWFGIDLFIDTLWYINVIIKFYFIVRVVIILTICINQGIQWNFKELLYVFVLKSFKISANVLGVIRLLYYTYIHKYVASQTYK